MKHSKLLVFCWHFGIDDLFVGVWCLLHLEGGTLLWLQIRIVLVLYQVDFQLHFFCFTIWVHQALSLLQKCSISYHDSALSVASKALTEKLVYWGKDQYFFLVSPLHFPPLRRSDTVQLLVSFSFHFFLPESVEIRFKWNEFFDEFFFPSQSISFYYCCSRVSPLFVAIPSVYCSSCNLNLVVKVDFWSFSTILNLICWRFSF